WSGGKVRYSLEIRRFFASVGNPQPWSFPLLDQAGSSVTNWSASTGQTTTQISQQIQSPGRGNQGKSSLFSRHSVGQTATLSPQPVHRVSSSSGSSCMATFTDL